MFILHYQLFWIIFRSTFAPGIEYNTQISHLTKKSSKSIKKKKVSSWICRKYMKPLAIFESYVCFLCVSIVNLIFLIYIWWFYIVSRSIFVLGNNYNTQISQITRKSCKIIKKQSPLEIVDNAWNPCQLSKSLCVSYAFLLLIWCF